MTRIDSVMVIGGGFSGALQAINLARHAGPRAILIERRPELGRGTAFATLHPDHLLNVRAANMSALPDDPDHFVRWLAAAGQAIGAQDFAPRAVYGRYLSELVADAQAADPGRIELIHGEAIDLTVSPDTATAILTDGRRTIADAAVLALGTLPPLPPGAIDPARLPAGSYVADPWSPGAVAGLDADARLLAIGTGLTMIDLALLLDSSGFRGRLTALSRRGLLPRTHATGGGNGDPLAERPAPDPTALLRSVRARADAIGWRSAVDQLRPFTQTMWLSATDDQRRRFLRHLRPWWDVHRHRIAPHVIARIDAMRHDGRLRIMAGNALSADPDGSGATVRIRPRGSNDVEQLEVARIINCSGPQTDLGRSVEPLLQSLAARGTIVADAQRLGLATDPQARTIDAAGAANERLYALGPLTRGTFWEITAVPDIRLQTWTVARRLSNAQWIGEGL